MFFNDFTITFYPEFYPKETRVEAHSTKDVPWKAESRNPMGLPGMYHGPLQFWNGGNLREKRAAIFSAALEMAKIHHGKHVTGETITEQEFADSPYSLYMRTRGRTNLAEKLPDSEVSGHLWWVFLGESPEIWNRSLLVPGYDASQATQRATLSTNTKWAYAIPAQSVVDAIQSYQRAKWQTKTPV